MAAPTTLLDRPDGSPLFRRAQGPVSAAAFLRDAHDLAAGLPDGRYLVNLCQDRYAFAVAFAAGLLRGRTSLLNAEPAALLALAADYPGCTAATDIERPGLPWPATPVRPLAAEPAHRPHNPPLPPGHLAAIVFTSGSTGRPTPHPKRWAALPARSQAACEQFALDGAAIVGTVPPQHMYGFETTILLPLHARVTSWCGPAFFPADVAAALGACPGPRVLVTTPLHLRTLIQAGRPMPSISACISATAPLDHALAADAEAAWSAPVLEIFGATECGSIASRRTTAGPDWVAYPGIQIAVTEAGSVVQAPGADPVPLADMIERTGAGFRLLGRRTDVIKLGGRRASLPGLNHLLTGVPGIEDGAFVLPDEPARATPRLVAIVVAPGRTAPAILADLRRVMDPIFVPRRVVRVPALPRNALGKLPRQALLQLLEQED